MEKKPDKISLEKALRESHPAEWDQIPDIDLYKDQLTEYLKRQHIGFVLGMEEPLTSAMINNYIKAGVLPRAKGKRYDRDHIACLTAVALLKQVLSVQETGELLNMSIDDGDVRAFYDKYRDVLADELDNVAYELDKADSDESIKELALSLAVRSYADKLLCRELLMILNV
ncbi:MAG: DUF1836 domain-containing protein [Eubacterium sp.]|nr:DUF1836 domain-containing protein [Eubacterium sp.]